MTTPDGTAVTLYDTTLRDGTQGENITLSLADKLRVARMLDEYGFPFIEGGWPGSNPKDIEFFAAARKERWQHAKLAAFGSTRHRANRPEADPNLRELVAAETPVVTIFGKSWLLHVIEVLGATPAENLDMVADSVAFVVDRGREAVYDADSPGGPPSSSRPRAAIHAGPPIPCRRGPPQIGPTPARYVPNPTTINRAFGARATTSGQAARRRSTPFETINLPT